jgi:8-amino-7-oxononanoate synthase
MTAEPWDESARAVLAGLDTSHLYRRRKLITSIDATHVLWDGREYVNFSSNNYLGLTHHPRVIAAAQESLRDAGTGSGASALITGYGPAHAAAEQHIARWKGTEAAIVLPSGYQANHAAIQTLAAVAEKNARPIRFLLDKLCHASLIDAVRGTAAPFRIFPHNHLPKLQRLLAAAASGQLQVVVTESIFSMDGDSADLAGLAKLKAALPFLLLVDEAHAAGIYGPAGCGLAAELGLHESVDLTVLTLSKALGSGGGAVCGSQIFCDALVNLARAYIYSTALPPALAAAADAAISVMESEPQRQRRVREIARDVRRELAAVQGQILPGDSPIIPLVMGSEMAALNAAESLLSQGLLTLPIRPPTVPRGTSRLRITLSSEHTDEEVERLLRAIRNCPLARTSASSLRV